MATIPARFTDAGAVVTEAIISTAGVTPTLVAVRSHPIVLADTTLTVAAAVNTL